MIFIAVGNMVGLLWNVLMSKTITSLRQVMVYKGDCSLEAVIVEDQGKFIYNTYNVWKAP